jgi:hypothetical protein
MKWQTCILVLLIGVVLYLSTSPPQTDAIPAFARRYKVSCTTCHAPFPRLKDYGAEFAGNGFYIPEEEKERDYVSAGDPLLWLNRTFPVAVRFEAFGRYDDGVVVDTDFQTPWGVKLLSGGVLAKNIGYYFYFYLSERGEVAGIEDAYVHFNNIKGTELDIMVGQFQVSDPLMKRELRLTYEDYEAYKTRIGGSRVNLAYDRGVMLPFSITKTGTDLVVIVVSGNSIAEAGEDRKYDEDDYKNVAFRVAQGLADLASIGGFAYYGKERAPEIELAEGTNETVYFGGDLMLDRPRFALTGQYLFRRDKNPNFIADPGDVDTHGVIAELILSPDLDKSRYHLTALYNRIDSDLDSADYETGTLSLSYLLARNIRLLGEYTYDGVRYSNGVTLGFISAF